MNKPYAGLLAIMLYCGGGQAILAAEHALDADNFTGTVTLTTDYVFRGISFSNSEPALQGSFDWSYGNFFAGAWGSSTTGASYELELDYYFGYADSFAGFDWYVQPLYYHFPGKDSASEREAFGGQPEAFEVLVGVSRALAFDGGIEPTASLLYAWGPDYFWDSGSSHYVYGNMALTLPHGFSLDAGIGYQDVSGDVGTHRTNQAMQRRDIPGFSYTHWDFGISTSLLGFGVDLRYHNTSDDGSGDDLVANFLDGATDLSDSRVVFSVSRSF